MRTLKKVLIILLAGVVVLVGVLALFIKFYLTDERLRAIAEPALEDALGREVTIGSLEVQLLRSFPDLSVGIDQLAIHTPPAGEELRPDLANVERIWVDMRLLPLLRSNVHVTALELDTPQILAEVYDDFSSNLIEWTSKGGEPADSSGEEAPAIREITVERILIRNGQIGYLHADGTVLTIGDLNANLMARLSQTVSIVGSIRAGDTYYETGGIPYADHWDVSLEMDALAHPDSAWLLIQSADLTVEQLKVALTGTVKDWDTDRIGVDMRFQAPDASVPAFWSLLPVSVKKNVEGLEGAGVFSLDATIQGALAEEELPRLDALLVVQDGMIQYPDLPSAIRDINLDAHITNEQITLTRLAATAAGAALTVAGNLRDFADPIVSADIDLQADLDAVTQYYPLEEGTELSGAIALDSKVEGRLSDPAAIRASGQASLDRIHYASADLQQPVDDLNGRIVLDGPALQLNEIALKTGQSDVQFNGRVERYAAFFSEMTEPGETPLITGRLTSSYFNATEQISEDTTSTEPVILPDLLVDVDLAIDRLDYEAFRLADARGKLTLRDDVIGFEGVTAQFLEGLLNIGGTFDLSDPLQPLFNANVDLSQLRASQFFTAFIDFDHIARIGKYLDALFDSRAAFGIGMDQAFSPQLQTLVAEGSFGASNGILQGLPLQEAISTFIGLDALKELSVRDWSHRFDITGERLHVQDLSFSAGDFRFGLNGSQGFDGSMNYVLSVELPQSASQALANAPVQSALRPITQLAGATLVDPASGRIVLDLLATGTFDKPAVRLNDEMMQTRLTSRATALVGAARAEAQARLDSLEQAARLRAEAELQAQKSKLEEQARQEAAGIIGNLVDSSAVSTDLDSLKEKGGEVLKDRLKGLLNRKKNN